MMLEVVSGHMVKWLCRAVTSIISVSEKPNMPYRAIMTEMDRSAYNAL